MEAEQEHFVLTEIEHNEGGWGPSKLPSGIDEALFAPYSKGDRLGRVAELGMNVPINPRERIYSTGVTNVNFNLNQQEENFQLVDNTKAKTSQPFRGGPRQRGGGGPRPPQNFQQRNFQKFAFQKNKNFKPRTFRRGGNWNTPVSNRDPSIDVKTSWKLLEEIEFSRLQKMSFPAPQEYTDLKLCGSLTLYDKAFDRITTKTERPLVDGKRAFNKVATTQDPVIRKLAETDKEANVFGTDSVISLLMAAPRSVLPWDIEIYREGNAIYFDKRADSQLDLETVNETAVEPPSDTEGINTPEALAQEATYVSQSAIDQILKGSKEVHKFKEQSPFKQGEVAPNKAYRYRKVRLGDKAVMIYRSELDAFHKGPNGNVFLNIKTLLEHDPKVGTNWRTKLDSQRGAVIATELKNNSSKLARWNAEGILSGVDHIKLAFVSRVNPKVATKHAILATHLLRPAEFSSQISFSQNNAWGIVKSIIDYCLDLPEGKYRLVKDPNKQMMRLYSVPANDMDGEEEEEEGEEARPMGGMDD